MIAQGWYSSVMPAETEGTYREGRKESVTASQGKGTYELVPWGDCMKQAGSSSGGGQSEVQRMCLPPST